MNMPRKPRLRRYWTVLCAKQPICHVRSQLSRAWCLTFHRWHGFHRYASSLSTDARYVLGLAASAWELGARAHQQPNAA
jgi:hypothetical protein